MGKRGRYGERETAASAAVGAFDPLTQHELNGATSLVPIRSFLIDSLSAPQYPAPFSPL